MSLDQFDDMLGAIRAERGDDAELADATRLRVRRSLETRARSHHQIVGLLTAAGILLGGTVSWALATGHIAALWTPAPVLAPISTPAPMPAPAPPPAKKIVAVPVVPVPETRPEPIIETPPPVEPPVVPPVRVKRPPLEALYRHAHELHFHGGDAEQTLAAWDAYLAAEPSGRFSVDARYNRGLVLVRLKRYADALHALTPFARGEVSPAGYRQDEAQAIVDRLAHAVNGSRRSGDDAP